MVIEYRLEPITKGLKKFPNGTFDMVYADPPYFRTPSRFGIAGGGPHSSYWTWTEEWLKLAALKVKDHGHIYISFTSRDLAKLSEVVDRINLKVGTDLIRWNNLLIWEYKGQRYRVGIEQIMAGFYWYNYEPIIYLSRGRRPNALLDVQNDDGRNSVWHIALPRWNAKHEKRVHPTQKPQELFRRLLGFSTLPGQWVLDCFTGSGVLLTVAESMGRHAIGFDIDKKWKDAYERKVRDRHLKLDAFTLE